MTPKIFLGLTVAAAVSLTAAGLSYYNTRTWTSSVAAGEPVFRDLARRHEEIALITIVKGDETITIERNEAGWGIRERDGYPASADEVRETIVGLTQMQVIESKTRNRELYDLLSLGDPAAEGAASKLVQLRDAEGNSVAELVLGKTKYGVLGPGRNGVYVRIPGDPQSWLVSGDIGAPLDVRGWAEKSVFDIPPADIARVTIAHGDGDFVVYEREDPASEQPTFRLANLPQGATLKSDADLPFEVRSIGQLELWDVRSAGTVEMAEGATEATIDIATVDGLHVTVHMVSGGADEYWLSAFAWGEGDAAERARAISDRARGWEFMVQSYKAKVFGKHMADLVDMPEDGDGGS
jgi:hypothetical protein